MDIEPIAYFHSPLTAKFGVPRQSGLAPDLPGTIVLVPEHRSAEAVRGLEGFDYLWLIWGFSANRREARGATVRPPRLGGNERVGVFASRSPFRPNGLGLSSVRIDRVQMTPDQGPVIHVKGADLMDGTPIYDIKPYVAYADSHPEARGGFTDSRQWPTLKVELAEGLESRFSEPELRALKQLLAQDPRPRYHDDAERIYGMDYAGRNVRFKVVKDILTVLDAGEAPS